MFCIKELVENCCLTNIFKVYRIHTINGTADII